MCTVSQQCLWAEGRREFWITAFWSRSGFRCGAGDTPGACSPCGGCRKWLTRSRVPEGNLSRQGANDPAAEAVERAVLRRGRLEDEEHSEGSAE